MNAVNRKNPAIIINQPDGTFLHPMNLFPADGAAWSLQDMPPPSESRYQKVEGRDNLVVLVLQGADLFPQITRRNTGQFRR